MKVTTEILNGIKYIKMSGWEKSFLKKVNFFEDLCVNCLKVFKTREGELTWQKKEFVISGFFGFFMWLTPMFITAAIFATYILIGNEMNAKTAFTLVSTVMILEVKFKPSCYICY